MIRTNLFNTDSTHTHTLHYQPSYPYGTYDWELLTLLGMMCVCYVYFGNCKGDLGSSDVPTLIRIYGLEHAIIKEWEKSNAKHVILL